ncbi:MAG: hypothetical protein WBM86_16155 [Waterburya sp.]
MSITRDFKETINDRVQKDPEFAKALLDEAISLFLNGEPETARLILKLREAEVASASLIDLLRDLMNITTELKKLADETGIKEIG